MSERLVRLRAAMQEQSLEALLITSAANRRYISGFRGSAGMLLITAEAALLISDFRYRVQVSHEAPAFELRESSPEQLPQRLIATAAAELGLHSIAIEAEHQSVAAQRRLQDALHEQFGTNLPQLTLADGLIESLREVKDADELATLRQAIAITDAAIEAVLPQLHPTHTERQAAWMLEAAMRERGADAVSFTIIVAAGPNGAQPHARPSDDQIGEGRPIVIDMGALLNGYHADLTRTVVLGEPDARFREIYGIVLDAQRSVVAGLRSGISGGEADALARNTIAAAGYGDHFGHGTGHGVGLAIHEGPGLRRGNQQVLRAGSIFSVEPGIYLDGWGGVRIEDLVLLHDTHAEVLSQARKLKV